MRAIDLIIRPARSNFKRFRAAAATMLAALAVGACDSRDGGVITEPERQEPVASVDVRPDEHLLEIGQTVQLSAVTKSAAGLPLAGRAVSWSSEDESVAIVSASGLAVARSVGTIYLRAASEGKVGRSRLIVRPVEQGAPAPVMASISPNVAYVGTGPVVVTISGGNFVPASRGAWNGAQRPTEYVSATELRMTVSAADLASMNPAHHEVTVATPAPGGGVSAPAMFTIRVLPPAPVLTELSPSHVPAGSAAPTTLRVIGQSFRASSRILLDGQPRETEYAGFNELRTTLSAAELATPRQIAVTVETPAPGGGTTAARTFTVSAPAVARLDIHSFTQWTWTNLAIPMRAVPRDALGGELTGRQVTWTSSAPLIARVQPTGTVIGAGSGRATITAAVEGISAQRTVTVYAAPQSDLVYDVGVGAERHLMIWTFGENQWRRSVPVGIPAYDPSPSPDGQRIAFTGVGASGNVDVYVVRRDGSGLTRLTSHDAVDDQPAWSPDGSSIAFRSSRSGHSDVWVMNADGTAPRQLTFAAVMPEAGAPGSGVANSGPAWSPDARQIAYSSSDVQGNADLWVMLADGSGKRRLTSTPDDDFDPTWKPDGQLITFRREGPPQTGSHVVSAWASSGELVWGVVHPGDGRSPSYSLDGQWLTFSSAALEGATLRVMPANFAEYPRDVATGTAAVGMNAAWMRR